MSYENPTFCLDNSVDSSFSSFLFDATLTLDNEEADATITANVNALLDDPPLSTNVNNNNDKKEEEQVTSTREGKIVEEILRGSSSKLLSSDSNLSIDSRVRGNSTSRINETKMEENPVRRGKQLDSACTTRDSGGSGQFTRQSSEPRHETSKLSRGKTVDNIASFLSSGRGSSFRAKSRGKNKQDTRNNDKDHHNNKDWDRIDYRRALATSASTSSRSTASSAL